MHLLFTPSEAPLSSILQNWKKLRVFHYCLAKGRTNFECVILILHTLNYHTYHSVLRVILTSQICLFVWALEIAVMVIPFFRELAQAQEVVLVPLYQVLLVEFRHEHGIGKQACLTPRPVLWGP